MNRTPAGVILQNFSKIIISLLIVIYGQAVMAQDTRLFEEVPSKKSGITFKNIITENEEQNALTHENLYNGGGVAAGDINNDGLDDLFFISNMKLNKLYLNLGNMKFKDITESAGVEGREGWKTGVTFVDINGDNLLDIYVCYSGKGSPEKRRNELYINNGNLKFEEKSREYGLDIPTYSTIGAFFDYDLDGDLDAFVVATNVRVIRGLEFDEARVGGDPYAGDKLLRNDNGRFVDVTESAGIISVALGYGLGVAISDLNKDGWPDIYVTNDYIEPDYLYINNGNGTFTNRLTESVQHISQSAMGNDIDDFNNDTWPDIFTSDMLSEDNKRLKLLYGPENYMEYALQVMQGFYHSSMRNMLQLNNGNGTFSEIGQLAGVSNTDWSWAPLFADYDNDGWKDLFVTNGYFKDYTNRDFLKYKMDYYKQAKLSGEKPDTFELVSHMTSTPVHKFMFRNNRDLTFTNKSFEWGFEEKGFCTGAVYSDLDNDGDLDLAVNNQNKTASLFRNLARESGNQTNYITLRLRGPGKNTYGLGSKVYVYTRNGVQYTEEMPVRGYQSSVSPNIHFGLGSAENVDSIVVDWPGPETTVMKNIKANQVIEIRPAGSRKSAPAPDAESIFEPVRSLIAYEHNEYGSNDFERQPLMISMLSTCGPVIAIGDVNGDKLTDVYVGGAKESPGRLYIQSKVGTYVPLASFSFTEDVNCTDADAIIFDADNDGDNDLYVVSGGYHDYGKYNKSLQDRLYLNNGTGKFTRTTGYVPQMYNSKSCVAPADFDHDGDIDLFVGGRVMPGEYPKPQESYFLVNDGKGMFKSMAQSLVPEMVSAGMVTCAVWIDLNRDSWPDLVTAGEFMPIRVFINEKGKKFTESTKTWFDSPEGGFWNKLAAADFDNDGNTDLLAGNFGTNSQIKASPEQPVVMTFKDFDNNGSVDPILTYYVQNHAYPFASRNEMLSQISSLRGKFPDFASYSEARLNDLFSAENLKSAQTLTATNLRTTLFMNNGNKFVKAALPVEAQFAPVHAIEVLDYNNDGNADFVLAGNQNAMAVRLGVMDASYGQLFEGNGKGRFRYVSQMESGLRITGDVRSLKLISVKGISYLLAGINNSGIAMYRMKSK